MVTRKRKPARKKEEAVVETPVEETPVEETKAEKKAEEKKVEKKKVAPVEHVSAQFLNQAIDLIKVGNHTGAIKAMRNVVGNMFIKSDTTAFDDLLKIVRSNTRVLAPHLMFQEISIIPPTDRSKIEVVFTTLYLLAKDKTDLRKILSVDMVQEITKSTMFASWVGIKSKRR